jgi:ABC-type transport system involved in multi-copper enzyme maturation permease subunit
MLKTIVRKELQENLYSYRFPLFAIICILLVPLGLYVNNLNYIKSVRDYNEQMRLADEAVASIQMQDVMAGKIAIKGFRPPALLSVFSQGFEGALPRFYEFTPDGYTPGESSSGEASILSVQGKIDFVFLIQMVLSLVGLLFASDVIAGEKESGTLRAMLSNSLPRDTILVGKITGGYLALWFPFIIAFLLGIVLLLVRAFPLFVGDTLARVLSVFLAASLFILIYFAIGSMISSSSSKTRTSLIVILLVWVSFQLVIPRVSDMAADVIYPIRTETQVSLEKSILAKSIDTETSRELGRRYVLIYGNEGSPGRGDKTTPEDVKWDAVKKEIESNARERKAQQVKQIDDAYGREKRIRQNIATNLSLFSPSAAFARLLADVCGTGEIARRKYGEAIKDHAQALDTALFSRAKRTIIALPGGKTSLSFSIQPIDVKALPKFTIAPTSLAEAFKEDWASLLSLAFWLIAPFAAAYVRFLRYDVR